MITFAYDFSAFKADFHRIIREETEKARRALFIVAAELRHDAQAVEPTTPKKDGFLRGSWKEEIEVNEGGTFSLAAGYDIEYAAYVHEMVRSEMWGEAGISWSEPGSGAKFLETKVVVFGNKYIGLLAFACGRALQGLP
jgi:hypothetical protein